MSKAFTRESDDAPDASLVHRAPELPPGAPNYITAAGARRLRDELDHLLRADRTGTASTPREVDQRIHALAALLDSAEVVEPNGQDHERVRFGATVTVRGDDDHETAYRIVGVAEADPRHGAISWVSPVARALIGARIGDVITMPGRGHDDVEIVAVAYEP
jgi:transcription elongation factor GreB